MQTLLYVLLPPASTFTDCTHFLAYSCVAPQRLHVTCTTHGPMKRPLPRLRSGATGASSPQLAHFTEK
jgi:hypothetical protein